MLVMWAAAVVILAALGPFAASRGNKSEAARVLGISRKNLYEKLARYEKTGAGCQVPGAGLKATCL